jgi:hypothetical protein
MPNERHRLGATLPKAPPEAVFPGGIELLASVNEDRPIAINNDGEAAIAPVADDGDWRLVPILWELQRAL